MNIPDARVMEDVIRRTISESMPQPIHNASRMLNHSPQIHQNVPSAGPTGSRPPTAPLDLNLPFELSQALQHRDYQTLFFGVVSHNDPFLLLTLIKNTPIENVFSESCELTQDVLLGLLEQISELIMNPNVDMQSKAVWNEIARGVQWLEGNASLPCRTFSLLIILSCRMFDVSSSSFHSAPDCAWSSGSYPCTLR